MRFLEYDFLKDHGLANFDNWVTVFGEQKTEWELAPAGNKFKERTRIANYTGMPELMSMFKQVADVRTADTLELATPEMAYHIENIEATDFQKTLVDELSDRADDVQSGSVDPISDTQDNINKLKMDLENAQRIVATPFPQQAELEEKSERLATLTDELNQAAMEAKMNAPEKQRTCYFERAKLKKEVFKDRQKPTKPKEQDKDKNAIE